MQPAAEELGNTPDCFPCRFVDSLQMIGASSEISCHPSEVTDAKVDSYLQSM